MIDLRKMRHLINRLPMARYRVDVAMSKATKVTATLSGMPHGSGTSSPDEQPSACIFCGIRILYALFNILYRYETFEVSFFIN